MEHTGIYGIHFVDRIVAGENCLGDIADIVRDFSIKNVMIVTDLGIWKTGLLEKPKNILETSGFNVEVFNDIPAEPDINQIDDISKKINEKSCELLIGIGGGSVMDTTKILSVLYTNDISIYDFIKDQDFQNDRLPVIMVPTTAGTGSEVTQNAIVTVPEHELKVGIVNAKLIPDCIILDPKITVKLPPSVTASTGADALTHALECYISKKANPLSDMYALESIKLISRSIRKAYKNGVDIDARHDMLLGAAYGGMCIASSGTTAVHALAYPLGGRFKIPHGASNAMLLPYVMEFNMPSITKKLKKAAIASGIDAHMLSDDEAAKKMIDNLYALIYDLNIPSKLGDYGITEEDIPSMAEAAFNVKRLLENNPRKMTIEDIIAVYKRAL